MRNMSFALTTEQIRNRTKTVTRRLGWWNLRPGDRVQAVVKCQGLKKGEKIQKLAVIEIVSVRAERLWDITDDECEREGFPETEDSEFVGMFCEEMNTVPNVTVNRIEFKYVEEPHE